MRIVFFGLKEHDKKDYFISSLPGHELVFVDQDLNEDNLPDDTNFEIISVFVQSKITAKVIDHFPSLKVIAIRATGFDNVDINYARQKGIIVSNVPTYGSHTVAEFTFGLILSLSRRLPQSIEKVKSDVEFDHEGLKGFDLYGKTIGVVGTGKIGANIIKIARGFGMIVLAFDVAPNEQLAKSFEFQYVSLEELMRDADVVTIHVPFSDSTHHLINQNNIFQMKKGSILINTSRGDVVETEALYKAISEGHLGGAGLDVIEAENKLSENLVKEEFEPATMKNLLEASFLIKSPNVIVTPHSAFYTTEAEEAIMQTTVENILGFIQGSPKNALN